ncbi:preprotein translocase subunit SecA [Tepidibacter thalassicus]|uniref:Protein translocase subunit SecA n=1 Tax=Tepidibacter thalassicus DSM 15285 TaxID=1123350 RepID=A0A1M5S6N3_9FIRM|nr:preprotein translocase subunit SecA [Tepidibacter thalassicus]SHH34146.1 protein translocase subunit secA [Tepidibacter thalassicus DSM 15285]
MKSFLGGLINPHDRKLNQLKKRVDKILAFEDKIKELTDEELRGKTQEFKDRLNSGEKLDDILEEAFAVVREASHRVLGMKHFPVQLMGGIVLHEGNISEMKTGEGKTLVATLPTYLNALTGEGVFVITVNEYLASRDKEQMGKLHEFLGLSVGLIKRGMSLPDKKEAYKCDITYGTNSEFGFDYLRDNMAISKEHVVQRNLNYAIIDEVDSILIDEARTPLIMTGEAGRPSQYYITVDKFIKSLKEEDYERDIETNIVNLTESGMDKAEKVFNLENIADIKNTELLHHIRQGLYANYVFERDKDYVVRDGEIIIVDKFTGRLVPGRRFSNGLHQAIEAKEGVEIQKESKTVAMITYQNYFRMFNKIAGMTGTAYTERQEFKDIYGMDVICIPTNKPVQRIDKDDLVFKNKEAKFKSVVDEVERRYKKGQPVLLGTIYIDESEKLSKLLNERNIPHKLLNAKQDKDEAEIISNAGQIGAVTIATNMAGRGTDIKLGDGVAELGGLFVLGTEKHDSRRIDNQLRGRSGRQGDPGESQFYISLEDSLFDKVKPEVMVTVKKLVEKLGLKDDEAIEDKLVSQAIEGVQKNVEIANYNARKSTLEFDQILNKQRETIYSERNKILNGEDMSSFIKDIIKDFLSKLVDNYTDMSPYPEEWDLEGLQKYLNKNLHFNDRIDFKKLTSEEIEDLDKDTLKEKIIKEALDIYSQKEKELGEKQIRYLERLTLMKSIDEKWVDHLDMVDQLRQGIGFQAIGGEKPIRVFNREAFNLFENMLNQIKELTVKSMFLLVGITDMDKEEQKRNDIQRIQFFSNQSDEVSFDLSLKGYKKDKVNAELVFNRDRNNVISLELPVKDEKVKVAISRPDNGWTNGLYELVLLFEKNNIILPFMLVDEYKDYEDELRIRVELNIKQDDSVEMLGELVYLEEDEVVKSLPVKIKQSGVYTIGLKKKDKTWKKGKYEFRITAFDRVVFRKYLLIS